MTAEVLVVGAGGPLGYAVGRELRARSVAHVLTSRRGGDLALDVGNERAVRSALREHAPRAVIHLARPALPPGASDIEEAIRDFERFVGVCLEEGVERFVFASSAAVYGDHRARPLIESDPLEGAGPYAQLKIRSEAVLAETPLASISLRIFNIYGPGARNSLVNRLATSSETPPRLWMTSLFVRDYVHVDDVARAMLSAVECSEPGGAINVGTGVAWSNLELAGLAPAGAFEAVPAEAVRSWSVADPALAEARLGWRASARVEEQFRRR